MFVGFAHFARIGDLLQAYETAGQWSVGREGFEYSLGLGAADLEEPWPATLLRLLLGPLHRTLGAPEAQNELLH